MILGKTSVVVGGYLNQATGFDAIVAGGLANLAGTSDFAAILGGTGNEATGNGATAVGGMCNRAGGSTAVAVGGESNLADGRSSTISGGPQRTVSSLNTSGNTAHDWVAGPLFEDIYRGSASDQRGMPRKRGRRFGGRPKSLGVAMSRYARRRAAAPDARCARPVPTAATPPQPLARPLDPFRERS